MKSSVGGGRRTTRTPGTKAVGRGTGPRSCPFREGIKTWKGKDNDEEGAHDGSDGFGGGAGRGPGHEGFGLGDHRRAAGHALDFPTAKVFAGNWVAIDLVGDGDTDLDLYVYDPFGRLVGYDDDATDHCLVRFYARYTGTYTIKVVDLSHLFSNRYEIAIDSRRCDAAERWDFSRGGGREPHPIRQT